jgi:O-antigen ligase
MQAQRALPSPAAVRAAIVVCVAALTAVVSIASAASPPSAALAVAAAVVVVACLARTDLAILALVATIPLESSVSISANPELTTVKLAGALCLLSWIVDVALRGRRLVLDLSHLLIVLLLAIALVSTLEAGSLDSALVRTLRYASFASLYLVVSQRTGDCALQRRIVWTLSLSASASSVLAIHNFLSGARPLAQPLYGDPNDFAYILATTLPLTLWLLGDRAFLRRIAVVAMAGVISAGITMSYSRGALVGLGAGLLWQVLVERRHVRVIVIAAVVVGAVVAGLLATDQARLSAALYSKNVVAGRNIDERLSSWDAAVRIAIAHPLLGVGPGNFQYSSDRVLDRPPSSINPTVVHDAYLDVAAELGFTGLVVFLAYLASIMGRLATSVRRSRGPPELAGAVRTAMVVAMVGTLTLSEQYYAPLWLLGALATCFWHERRRRQPA